MSLFAKTTFLLFVFLLISRSNATLVTITNNLEGNADLHLHCKSADDDLQEQFVPSNQNYHFSFEPRYLIGNTQFYCSFQWENSPVVYFDIYIETRDQYVCYLCNWIIKKEGPCRLDRFQRTCYDWNK